MYYISATGDQNIVWPGLNSPILKSNSLVKRTQLPPDPEYKEYLVKRRKYNYCAGLYVEICVPILIINGILSILMHMLFNDYQ